MEVEIEYVHCYANFGYGYRCQGSHVFMVTLSEAHTQCSAAELCTGRSLDIMASKGKSTP